jgi:hypothetical protein
MATLTATPTSMIPSKITANALNITVLIAVLCTLYYFFYPKIIYYWMKFRAKLRSYKIDLNFLYL